MIMADQENQQQPEPTELVHLTYDGNFALECESTVVSCCRRVVAKKDGAGEEEQEVEVQLDRTAMHPQGGGQPTDKGKIISLSCEDGSTVAVVEVEKVSIDRATNVVTHAGKLMATVPPVPDGEAKGEEASPPPPASPFPYFAVGSKVRVVVDADRRRLMSECHTAGHVVDSAMARSGKASMPPTKGYHFLEGPYVEYKGAVPPEERDELLEKLKVAFQELVNEDIETTIQTLPRSEAEELCNRVAHNFDFDDFCGTSADEDSTARVVTVAGFPCPCGGTHVRSTGELKERKWGVKGPIKSKKGVVRIRYGPDCA